MGDGLTGPEARVEKARETLGAKKSRGARFAMTGPETHLVVEGPPRSANSFTVRMLQAIAGPPQHFRIAHHSHSADNLLSGAGYGTPLVVLARKPADAILSYAIYSGRTAQQAARRYASFYEALDGLEGYVIGHFDEITCDFNAFLARLNTVLPTPLPLVKDMDALLAEVDEVQRAALDKRAREEGRDTVRQTPMPTEGREKLKEEMRTDVLSLLARNRRAEEAYARFVERGDRPQVPVTSAR